MGRVAQRRQGDPRGGKGAGRQGRNGAGGMVVRGGLGEGEGGRNHPRRTPPRGRHPPRPPTGRTGRPAGAHPSPPPRPLQHPANRGPCPEAGSPRPAARAHGPSGGSNRRQPTRVTGPVGGALKVHPANARTIGGPPRGGEHAPATSTPPHLHPPQSPRLPTRHTARPLPPPLTPPLAPALLPFPAHRSPRQPPQPHPLHLLSRLPHIAAHRCTSHAQSRAPRPCVILPSANFPRTSPAHAPHPALHALTSTRPDAPCATRTSTSILSGTLLTSPPTPSPPSSHPIRHSLHLSLISVTLRYRSTLRLHSHHVTLHATAQLQYGNHVNPQTPLRSRSDSHAPLPLSRSSETAHRPPPHAPTPTHPRPHPSAPQPAPTRPHPPHRSPHPPDVRPAPTGTATRAPARPRPARPSSAPSLAPPPPRPARTPHAARSRSRGCSLPRTRHARPARTPNGHPHPTHRHRLPAHATAPTPPASHASAPRARQPRPQRAAPPAPRAARAPSPPSNAGSIPRLTVTSHHRPLRRQITGPAAAPPHHAPRPRPGRQHRHARAGGRARDAAPPRPGGCPPAAQQRLAPTAEPGDGRAPRGEGGPRTRGPPRGEGRGGATPGTQAASFRLLLATRLRPLSTAARAPQHPRRPAPRKGEAG
ncbi:hypothetical protein C7M84_000934 [Penaeus vannamei]|uniref:Uncharacterized protein n=1 Tax=Penaeus vannamei TaxID=6689 RepID=A0A423TV50_PENVA|nr:hypothetical protein C7M84_000934 [Penaeus vannamei]